jgi:hypothetical protein
MLDTPSYSGSAATAVNEDLARAWEAANDGSRPLLYSLMLALVRTAGAARRGEPWELRLPHAPEQLSLLRRWDFQAAVESAALVPLRDLVSAQDRSYFGGDRGHADRSPVSTTTAPNLADLVSQLEREHFFGFWTYPMIRHGALAHMIRHEWLRWRDSLMLQVLDSHAFGPSRDVARVLVHELLANSIQHPDASVSVFSTAIELSSEQPALMIALWDDGNGIIETLREYSAHGLRAGFWDIDDTFALRCEGWTSAVEVVSASWEPPPDAHEAELLAASILPGISRKPHVDVIQVDRPEPVEWESRVGFGLHAMYRSAVDAFRGDVEIRTGEYSLRLRASENTSLAHYELTVSRVADEPPLLGNLIWLRLPLTP